MNNFEKHNLSITEGKSKMPSVVLRKCCACGKISDRNIFIRIMQEHASGKIIINPDNFQFGRSIYLCKNEECIKIALKKKKLKNLSEQDIEKITKLSLTD